jgi:hypothetical protein
MKVTSKDSGEISIQLTKDELLLINNALAEICGGPSNVDAEEFHPRLGVEKRTAELLLAEVGTAFDSMKS